MPLFLLRPVLGFDSEPLPRPTKRLGRSFQPTWLDPQFWLTCRRPIAKNARFARASAIPEPLETSKAPDATVVTCSGVNRVNCAASRTDEIDFATSPDALNAEPSASVNRGMSANPVCLAMSGICFTNNAVISEFATRLGFWRLPVERLRNVAKVRTLVFANRSVLA